MRGLLGLGSTVLAESISAESSNGSIHGQSTGRQHLPMPTFGGVRRPVPGLDGPSIQVGCLGAESGLQWLRHTFCAGS